MEEESWPYTALMDQLPKREYSFHEEEDLWRCLMVVGPLKEPWHEGEHSPKLVP